MTLFECGLIITISAFAVAMIMTSLDIRSKARIILSIISGILYGIAAILYFYGNSIIVGISQVIACVWFLVVSPIMTVSIRNM